MNEKDREKITANCERLVQNVDWVRIWPKLFEHRIYPTSTPYTQRLEANLTDTNTAREIYLSIKKRGPNAFVNFLRCLEETGHEDLAEILKSDGSRDILVDIPDVSREHNNSAVIGNAYNANYISHGTVSISSMKANECNVRNSAMSNLENRSSANIQTRNDSVGTANAYIPLATQPSQNTSGDDFWARLHIIKYPLKVKVIKSTAFMGEEPGKVMNYAMRSNPRGLVLMITNSRFFNGERERDGAEHDEKNLRVLFEQMGFSVESCFNRRAKEMAELIEKFSKRHADLRKVHSIFVIIMSHGSEQMVGPFSESLVKGVDNEVMSIEEITNYFTAAKCPNMAKKPKIFIFQTCRGTKTQPLVMQSSAELGLIDVDRNSADVSTTTPPNSNSVHPALRDNSDILVINSTLPGHVTYRDKYTGSWFIQVLCEVFMNHAHDTEILRLLQICDARLSSIPTYDAKCQTSHILNAGFFKTLYLNPGFFETDT